jgi:hypothetical protein
LPEKISEESRRRVFQTIQTVWAAWGNLGFFSHAAPKKIGHFGKFLTKKFQDA